MTAVCGGGTSSARPGYGALVYMAPSAVGAMLNNIPTPWAVPLAAAIGFVTYEMSTFCTNDPPAMPTFTSDDVVDLLNYGDIARQIAAADKFRDMVGAFMWPQLCQCDTTTTPAIPAAPTEPTGMPSVNPVTPTTPDPNLSTPCYHWCHSCAPFSTLDMFFSGSETYPLHNVLTVQSGMTGMNLRFYWTVPVGAGGVGITVTVLQKDAAGATIRTTSVGSINSSGPTDYFLPMDPNTVTVDIAYSVPLGRPSTASLHTDVDGYCADEKPGGNIAPCCPPDPIIEQLLQNILGMVTLIQRQSAPFAYVLSTSHPGLTGRGSISVQGLLGARVEVTAFGSNTGEQLADPEILWEAGWVNWGSADGVSPRQHITNVQMLSFPAAAGQYTSLHYSLEPNVTVTITELVREP